MTQISLHEYLTRWENGNEERAAVASTLGALAGVSIRVAEAIWRGNLSGKAGAVIGANTDGDAQKALDVEAHDHFVAALKHAPVARIYSEEEEDAITVNAGAPLDVAMDPLDGSSNIDTNLSVGTIFSILPATAANDDSRVLPLGDRQLAAGFFIYGPATALVLTVREGVQIFTLDRSTGRYVLSRENVKIPERKPEYAINASNYRHWDEPVRAYIDDCIVGVHGPREANFNMRWNASLVAEAYRIFVRGGIFLYPRDARPGYKNGRLRLVYEANPIALLIEEAGGAAVEATSRILEIQPTDIHQRTPLIFGSRRMVERVAAYHEDLAKDAGRSPLFGARGLFRV